MKKKKNWVGNNPKTREMETKRKKSLLKKKIKKKNQEAFFFLLCDFITEACQFPS